MKTKALEIKLSAVKSSNIESIGHEGITLAVRFKSGGLYHYAGVTAKQFQDFSQSKSLGAAIGAIKAKHKATLIK